jgi:predicted ATP-grasp superfamily ATP-dependent carboligase
VSQPGAVVIGGYATAVSALRSLAREGVRTAVILTDRNDIAHRSRYAHEFHRVRALDKSVDGLIDLLQEQGLRWRGWALIPTTDDALGALAAHRNLLSRCYPMTVPSGKTVQQVLERAATYRTASELGIAVPSRYGPATRQTAGRSDIVYPVVVKPTESSRFWKMFGTKLFVARSPLELVAAIDRLEQSGLTAELLDLVPGSDDQCYTYSVYLDRWGKPAAEFCFRILRKAPRFFGDARAAEPALAPELRDGTIALLEQIGWQGVASVEYKRDPRDGRYRLLGITGRAHLSHGLATRCGVNFPLLSWLEHARHQPVSASANGWSGRWLHLHTDLLYCALQERHDDVSWRELLRSYTNPWVDAVWSAADPAPFVAQCIGTLKKAAREIREGRERETLKSRVQPPPPEMFRTSSGSK